MRNYFKQLRIDGIIKGYGISLRSPLDYLKIKNFDLDIVEFNFNLFDQRALDIDLFNLRRIMVGFNEEPFPKEIFIGN